MDALYEKRKQLKNKTDVKSQLELKEVELKLTEKCAENNYNIIREEISKVKVEEEGLHVCGN